jgi:hypothetical protein
LNNEIGGIHLYGIGGMLDFYLYLNGSDKGSLLKIRLKPNAVMRWHHRGRETMRVRNGVDQSSLQC